MSANYEKSAAEKGYEEQAKKDYAPSQLTKGTDPGTPSDNGFVAVDPVYQNFANDTEKPYKAEKGAEKKFEESVYADDADFDAGATDEGESDEDDEDEKPTSSNSPASTPNVPNTPSS